MRNTLISVSMVLGLSFGIFILKRSDLLITNVSTPPSLSASREPASGVSGGIRNQSYVLNREVLAVLTNGKTKKEFAHVHYQGVFTLAWKNENTARVLFSLESGEESQIPFEVTFKKDGTVDSLKTAAAHGDADEDAVNILKDFISLYAFKGHEDTAGTYEARFREWNGKIIKQKLHYEGAALAHLKITDSIHEMALDREKSSWTSMKGEEKIETIFGKNSLMITTSSYVLKPASVGISTSAKTLVAAFTLENLKATTLTLNSKDRRSAVDWAKTLGNVKFLEALDHSARLSVFHDLILGIKESPDHLAEFIAWMNVHIKNTGVLTFGIGVLASAGTNEAQKALLAVYQTIPESRHLVLNAMATTDAPLTPEIRSFLTTVGDQKQESPDLSLNAALAMGAAMKKGVLSGEDQKLMAWYSNSGSLEEKTLYLDAMGNSGQSAFVPTLEKALSSGEEELREKAAFAARFMKPEDARTLVSAAYDDSSVKVKTAAIKAISYQNSVAPFQSVLNRCVGEKSVLSVLCLQILNASHG